MKKFKSEKPSPRSSAPSRSKSPALPINLEEQIRMRAYQLYEERGKQDGFAEQDWIRAEGELQRDANGLKATA